MGCLSQVKCFGTRDMFCFRVATRVSLVTERESPGHINIPAFNKQVIKMFDRPQRLICSRLPADITRVNRRD